MRLLLPIVTLMVLVPSSAEACILETSVFYQWQVREERQLRQPSAQHVQNIQNAALAGFPECKKGPLYGPDPIAVRSRRKGDVRISAFITRREGYRFEAAHLTITVEKDTIESTFYLIYLDEDGPVEPAIEKGVAWAVKQ